MVQPVRLPALLLHGGCQCGRVRYTVSGVPLVFYLCHCTECQRHTASAFGQSMWVRREEFSLSGELGHTKRPNSSGETHGHFCPSCGVRIFHDEPGSKEITLKAGSLDDTSWLFPAGHIWTRSRQPWVVIGADELSAPAEPESFEPYLARWRDMLEAGAVAKM